MKSIRIGCGQGFWGDSIDAPAELVQSGALNYLVLDYLAEVTMSILARQRQKNPAGGYARDFVSLIGRLAPELSARRTKLIANAGGINPIGCAEAIKAELERCGLAHSLTVGVVTGDNIFDDLDSHTGAGESFANFDDGRDFKSVRSKLVSANVYLGAAPIVEALASGADIVVCGRVADPMLCLAPLIHEFGWAFDDWDRLAAGVVAGHAIECGAQATGGNFLGDWQNVPDLDRIGYPIVEVNEDGSFVVTKAEGSGGLVSTATVSEQLIYEIGDPKRYVTPDVVADFTSFTLAEAGANRVCISGVRGAPRPEKLKVSMSYADGYVAEGTMLYSWPEAVAKARRAGELVFARLDRAGIRFERKRSEIVGVNACHGALSDGPFPEAPEAMLRVAVHSPDRSAVERFTREVAPLVLNGPPCATSYFGSKGSVREVFAYWPTLISRERVRPASSIV